MPRSRFNEYISKTNIVRKKEKKEVEYKVENVYGNQQGGGETSFDYGGYISSEDESYTSEDDNYVMFREKIDRKELNKLGKKLENYKLNDTQLKKLYMKKMSIINNGK
jgi:hypothetical protein